MKKNFEVIALIFFLLATLGIFYFQVKSANADKIKNWGMADAKEINVNSKISGKIESIRRKADFATQKATSERGETDIISFNLKVRADNEKIFPGMRFRMENK